MGQDQSTPENMDILLCGTSAEGQSVNDALRALGHRVYHIAGSDNRATTTPDIPQFIAQGGKVDLIIDAAHPFDMASHTAADAQALRCGALLWHLDRPKWDASRYKAKSFDSFAQAIVPLSPGARVFVATGYEDAQTCLARSDVHFFIRQIEKHRGPLAPNITFLNSAPPFSVDEEIDGLQPLNLTHMIIRNAGGGGARPKVDAAHHLGIKLHFITAPQVHFENAPHVIRYDDPHKIIAALSKEPRK